MSQVNIFYSWQSDLPTPTNWTFIQSAIELASKNIAKDDSIKLKPVIDRDTWGVPGSPDIATTIFEKIEEAQVFIADVSIINRQESSRPTPNPNVLIETGYAIRTLGMERILLVMNTIYGTPEQLPFDLRGKRVITYEMPEEVPSRADERRILAGRIEVGLRFILDKADLRIPLKDALVEKISELKKWVGKMVSIDSEFGPFPADMSLKNPRWPRPTEALLFSVDSSWVIFEQDLGVTNTGEPAKRKLSEPMEKLILNYDPGNQRLLILIKQ